MLYEWFDRWFVNIHRVWHPLVPNWWLHFSLAFIILYLRFTPCMQYDMAPFSTDHDFQYERPLLPHVLPSKY